MLTQKSSVYYLLFIFFCCLGYAFFSGDILPLKYSDLFDVRYYIEITQNFSEHLRKQDFPSYYNSRLFAPGIAHFFLNLLHIDPNSINIQKIFLLFNFLSIIIAIFYYYKISRIREFSRSVTILGFCFLFVNFFVLKFSNYYPVLMDVFGFTSGILLYYFYLSKKTIKFYLALLVSMFVFPTTVLILVALLISNLVTFNEKKEGFYINVSKYTPLLMLLVAGLYVFVTYYFFDHLFYKKEQETSIQWSGKLLPLSLVAFLVFLYFTVSRILKSIKGISISLKHLFSVNFGIALGLLLIYIFSSKVLSVNFNNENPITVSRFFINILFQTISFPFKFLIAHFIYYGAFVIFILIFNRDFFEALQSKANTFFKIVIIIFIIFFFGTETRQFLQLYPFIVIIFLESLRKYKIKNIAIFSIFLFQIMWSRFWYTINTADGFLSDSLLPNYNFMNFPAQKYFQFQGPWLSTENSVVYGVIFLATFAIVFFAVRTKKIFKENTQNEES